MNANKSEDEILSFVVEWFDPMPQMKKRYLLKFFPESHEVEMVDAKIRRLFLKRSKAPPTLIVKDLRINNTIVVYSRNLEIVDYGDSYTRSKLQPKEQSQVVILTPDAYPHIGAIISTFEGADIDLRKLRMVKFSHHQAVEISRMVSSLSGAAPHLTSNVSVVIDIIGEGVEQKCADLVNGMASHYSSTPNVPAIACAANNSEAMAVRDFVFGKRKRELARTATYDSCTCVCVLPHAIRDNNAGAIISDILDQGYEVSAMEMFHLDKASAAEFLEVYKGVVPNFQDKVDAFISGFVLAMEVRAENAVPTMRETAGPWDIEMARELRPDTLRAKYGIDRCRTGVHITDLAEDGVPECQYFFDLLQSV